MRIISILCLSFVLFCSSGISSVEKTVFPNISVEESTLNQPLNAGVANQVYVITDPSNEKRILKIFARKSFEDLKHSEELLELIRNAGISVPDSIVPPSKVGHQTICVLEFIDGVHAQEQNLPQIAELMGTLHSIETQSRLIPVKKDYSRLFDSCKNWEYCAPLKALYQSLDLSYLEDLPSGLIHGDFSYTNVLAKPDGSLSLIDFDHLRRDYLLTDLVRCQLFYGFDSEGHFKEDRVQKFVSKYDSVRPLSAVELDAFYTHMKLCLLDVAFEMYDHMYVKKDMPLNRVHGNPYNACLDPDLLAREILSLESRASFVLKNRTHSPVPIFFFGLSGAGKTTLINLLVDSSELFYIPKFTVTREARNDDNPLYFEYLSVDEFTKKIDQGEFYVWMDQQGTYYGYRFENLVDPDRFPLMNASAYGIDQVSKLQGVRVLIEGDAQQGLLLRNNPEVMKTREKVNKIARERFFDQAGFRQKMDLIFQNQFGDPSLSAGSLKKQILNEIDHADR